jgi:predicted MFS family arabinose efflux permease
LLILSFMIGIGSALNAPAWQSIIPELVPHNELSPAVTLNSINYNLSRAAGPAIGGLVVAWLGAGANFLINAASFLGVILVLYGWKREAQPGVLPGERVVGAIRAGVRYVRYAPILRAVLIRTAAFTIGASAMWAVLPLIARWRLGLGAAGFGLMLGWFGLGAVIGGALLARVQRILSFDNIVHVSSAIFILITVGLAMTRDPMVAYALLAIGGAAWTSAFSILNVAAQLSVPRWVQGRALAVYQIVLQGGLAGGSLVWGVVGEKFGLPIALFAGAGALVLGFATFKYRISGAGTLDLETVELLPAPQTAVQIQPDGGPVLITVEYKINPQRAEEFVDAMRELRRIRLRDGAVYWGLFFDAAEPDKFLEHFVTETWVEHLRQHERMVQSDVVFASTARSFHIGEHPPAVKHLVSGQAVMRHEVKFGPSSEDRSEEGPAQSRLPLNQK